MDMATAVMAGARIQREREDKMEDQRKKIEENREEDEIDLVLLFKSFWRIFSRMWWLVVFLVLVGAAGFYGFQKFRNHPMYACSATFTVATGDGDSGTYNFYYNTNTADQLSKTFPYILNSSFFKSTLLEKLGEDTLNGTITSQTVENSNVVTMRVESSSPEESRKILDAALEIYPDTARFVLGDIQFSYLDEPETPTEPFNRVGTKRSLVYGGLGGALAGCMILGIMALLRKTARNPEEMRKITSLRCLAMIPKVRFKARKSGGKHRISVLDKRLSYGYRESLRALGLRLETAMEKEKGKVLLVTSTVSGEGKSTLAVNISEILAANGKNVTLIDGDLRKQEDAALLGVRDGAGIQDIVSGDRPVTDALRKLNKRGIWFVGSKKPVRQPAPVLSSPRIAQFIEALKKQMDYIVIDTSPCGLFQDAGILADLADGILYVVKYDEVSQRKIWEGISFLRERKAGFLGYVFNSYPESAGEYGYGRYGYGKYGYGRYGYGYRSYGKQEPQDEEEEND